MAVLFAGSDATYHPRHVSVSRRLVQAHAAKLLEAQVEAVHRRRLRVGGPGVRRRHGSPPDLRGTTDDAALLAGGFLVQHLTLNVTHFQNLQREEGEPLKSRADLGLNPPNPPPPPPLDGVDTDRGSEELPVSEVHVHLLLQLVDVALRQNSAVHVRLRTEHRNNGVILRLATPRPHRVGTLTFLMVARY